PMAPLIGITTYLEPAQWGLWDITAPVLPRWYIDLFQEAGATPVMLPPGTSTEVIDRIDGLVIAGGADVDSRLYGETPHETADAPREVRDASEIALYRAALDAELPVLGICRGVQIMAVAHGGALHQHVPEVTELPHKEAPLVFVEHGARFEPGSRIHAIYGDAVTVNSFHHQAVKDPGTLRITGTAEDGTVEVCEVPGSTFIVGVQWHPEHPNRRVADRPLIDAFLAATG
ncbi:MAG: gamma-glutamyl-gamma-aminobutyrate hydrolase family protein, partial [Actinomycetota bacterium]